jgi:hypothetical protein
VSFRCSGGLGRTQVRRRPEVDAVLARPEVRVEFEELKRLIGKAADLYGVGDREGHERAALEASAAIWRIVEWVQGSFGPGPASPIESALYAYVGNVAQHELLDGLGPPGGMKVTLAEMSAPWPPGRPSGRRPKARQQLIDEVRAHPDMPDWRIEDRGRTLGVWTSDQAQDRASKRRRIKRIREDATN